LPGAMQAGIAHDLVGATRWFEGDRVGGAVASRAIRRVL
jgi:hypothetical protein